MKKTTPWFLLLCAYFLISPASAKVYIQVGQAQIKKNLLAFPSLKFFGSPGLERDAKKVGHTLYTTIYNDLNVSSYFRFIEKKSFLENIAKTGLKPKAVEPKNGFDFSNWSPLGTEFLIKAGYNILGGQVELTTYVYHVPSNKLIFGKKY